jgi:iron(III) transport system substrate-binding protein
LNRHPQLTRCAFFLSAIVLLVSACGKGEAPPPAPASEAQVHSANLPLVVFAAMPATQLQPVLEAYTAETGNKVELITADGNVSTRSGMDAAALPHADLYLAEGLSELWRLAEIDGFRPVDSMIIEENIPAVLRDQEFRFTALATHSTGIVYNTELIDAAEFDAVQDYGALGASPWLGKLCLSSSKVPGNLILVASLIRSYDLREAEIVVRSWRANLASSVFASDDELIRAIAGGQCAVGIARSNAIMKFISGNSNAPLATHYFRNPESIVVDVSGGGVMRHADNPDGAAKLLEWLTTESANALYASLDRSFPANSDSPAGLGLESWKMTVAAPHSLSDLGFLQEDAVLLVERARYP